MAYDPRYPISIYNLDAPTRQQINDGERYDEYIGDDDRVYYHDISPAGGKTSGSYNPDIHRLEGGQLRPATQPWE